MTAAICERARIKLSSQNAKYLILCSRKPAFTLRVLPSISFSLLVEFIYFKRGNPLLVHHPNADSTVFHQQVVKSSMLKTFHQGTKVTM